MNTFEVKEKIIEVIWRNVLVNHSPSINFDDMVETAASLGYPLILWDGQVYFVAADTALGYLILDTHFTEIDII